MSFLSTSAFFRPSHGFSFFLSFHSSRLPLSPPSPCSSLSSPPPSPCSSLALLLIRKRYQPRSRNQGWTNFKKELKALRESVRFGAPGPRAAPPRSALGMAALSAAKALSEAAFAADVRLEAVGVFPRLAAPATKDRALAADDDVAAVAAGGENGGNGEGKKKVTRSVAAVRQKLATLTLDDAAVWQREKDRERSPGHYKAPLPVRFLYLSLCVVLDFLYAGRPIQRFWVLETVARMPYFAYISMLHLYESLGWWRAGAELRRVHFAEEWNELHHLQVCFFLFSFFPFVFASLLSLFLSPLFPSPLFPSPLFPLTFNTPTKTHQPTYSFNRSWSPSAATPAGPTVRSPRTPRSSTTGAWF